nr:M10 family metallopeptidase C-terminal domain-containing protein [uncultured Rhizobium sp.]
MAIYFGTSAAESFYGTSEADNIFAEAGDDIIYASAGADLISGSLGRDTLVFSGASSDYTIVASYDSYLGSGAIVRDLRDGMPDGFQTSSDVEILRFSDRTIEVDRPVIPDPWTPPIFDPWTPPIVIPSPPVLDPWIPPVLTPWTPPVFDPWTPPSLNFAPTFPQLSKSSVNENTAIGTVVGTLTATDPEGMTVSFYLNDSSSFFAINGDKLVVAKPLDFEVLGPAKSISINVEARDPAGNATSWAFLIDINNVVDKIVGTKASQTLKGASGADEIDGGAGNDKLYGYAGKDKLIGGTGKDTLTGGTDADLFVFRNAAESKGATVDTILDFSRSQKDKIDLSQIDANSKLAGSQDFSFIGTKNFSGKAGELRYEKHASDSYVYGDLNGDKKIDFAIHFDDPLAFSKGDFLF